ncbi:MAG TPA: hypothetical protein VGN20_25800 [Mucilaginibacter sp.]|jgi:nitrogen-specific signal transduction histidine kinase
MEESTADKESQQEFYENTLRTLRHDIKNQLSNIYLALEQLRYELPDASEDCVFYMDLLAKSSSKIDTILKQTE